jgi:hypothetical protein
MPSEAVNIATRLAWRELGFYYDRDYQGRTWTIAGSRRGLLLYSQLDQRL